MAGREAKPLRGLGTQSEQITVENLVAQGVGATDSSFTETSPRPGQATNPDKKAKLVPQISGGQGVAVDLEVVRGGHPERGQLGMVWRLDSDTTDDAWRGKPPPNFLNHWVGAVWSDVDENSFFDLVTLRQTQELILLYVHSGPGVISEKGHARLFDFTLAQPAWGAEIDVTNDPQGGFIGRATYDSCCGVELPNGRVLSYWQSQSTVSSYFSDDSGATWSAYALPALSVFAGVDRMRPVFYRGDIAIFTGVDDPAQGSDFQTIRQHGSNSLGTKFIEVSECDDCGTSVSAVAIPGNGGIVGAYSNFADDFPAVRILSSCFDPIDDAAEIIIDTDIEVTDCSVSVDGTGTLWFIGRDTTAPANPQDAVWVWSSIDGGATWQRIKPSGLDDFGLHVTHDNSTRIVNFATTFCRGWMVTAHNWVASPGDEGGSIGTLWSGGWSSLSTGGVDLERMFKRRISWAADSGNATTGSTGIPIELPEDTIWNRSGTAPTLEAPGELERIVVAANSFDVLSPATPTPGEDMSFMWEGKITSGTGSSTSLAAGFEMEVSDGTFNFQVEIRFDDANSRIRVFDVHGPSIVVDIPIDVSGFVQVMAAITALSGGLKIIYRRPFTTHWIDATPGFVSLTDAGVLGSVNVIRKGCIAAPSTVTIRERQWHHFNRAMRTNSIPGGFEIGLEAAVRITAGGEISTLPEPVPEIGTATDFAFLAAERGPGRDQSAFSIPPLFDFGIRNIFSGISPSPADPWRSTNKDEQLIVWDFTEPTRIGQVWLLVAAFLNANFKTAFIEATSGTIYTTLATYNAAIGFEGLTYERNGDTIRPAAGTIDAARYLDRNVLRDGYVDLGGGSAAKILRNSAGGWTDPTVNTTLLPEIKIELTGGEPASGTCDLVFPAGVTFHTFSPELPAATQYFRHWRIRIPANQVTPDAFYQIGNFFLGSANVFGKQNSRGWSQNMEPNTARRGSRRGTIRKKQLGPPARRWSFSWADGVFLGRLRAEGVNQTFISPAPGDAAVATVDDVWTFLWGLLEETNGGESAVLALSTIPATDTTITDRLRFLYGTWDSGVQFNQVEGSEDKDEFGRIDPTRVSELV